MTSSLRMLTPWFTALLLWSARTEALALGACPGNPREADVLEEPQPASAA